MAAVDYQALGEGRVGDVFAVHREGKLLKNTIEAIRRMEAMSKAEIISPIASCEKSLCSCIVVDWG